MPSPHAIWQHLVMDLLQVDITLRARGTLGNHSMGQLDRTWSSVRHMKIQIPRPGCWIQVVKSSTNILLPSLIPSKA